MSNDISQNYPMLSQNDKDKISRLILCISETEAFKRQVCERMDLEIAELETELREVLHETRPEQS